MILVFGDQPLSDPELIRTNFIRFSRTNQTAESDCMKIDHDAIDPSRANSEGVFGARDPVIRLNMHDNC